ncbi:hypothetical protein WUBG_10123 [Wuchereria bancrofti]|uniref:Uncharacterized protein n=1 Tax=Wuchereria bancrofti TaxID=6293 RepID=J9AWL9_WUCBA|nr:hypothetical protein WUBG_10123 [Wuchereria bancrofti]
MEFIYCTDQELRRSKNRLRLRNLELDDAKRHPIYLSRHNTVIDVHIHNNMKGYVILEMRIFEYLRKE